MAIDLAVREMLDVEPPPGLRGRVLDGIESPRRGFTWIWIAAPLAAAAVVILALVLPAEPQRTVVNPVTTIAAREPLPQPTMPGPKPSPRIRPTAEIAGRVAPAASERTISAAVAPDDPDLAGARLEALDGPAPLTIVGLAGPRATAIAAIEPGQSIEPAPLQIRALEVNALAETPRERREE